MYEGGSFLSLTSFTSETPLADLNCTRRGGRNGTHVPLLPGVQERVKKKRKKQETHGDENKRVNVWEDRERVHRCEKIRPLWKGLSCLEAER